MKRLTFVLVLVYLGLAAPGGPQSDSSEQSGTLVFVLKNYTSDAKIPKKSQKTLEHGGIRFGLLDHSLIFSYVSDKFVKIDTTYLTRFGEQRSLQLKPGHYTITCIGLEFDSTTSNIDKYLAKSAYFNNDVAAFTVLPGKNTTLEASPVYEAESHWRGLTKLTLFIPDLKLRVLEDGKQVGEEVVINKRTNESIAWNDYHGPLKF